MRSLDIQTLLYVDDATCYLQVQLLTSHEGNGGGGWGAEGLEAWDNGHFTPRAIPTYLCVSALCTVSASRSHFLLVII